MATVEQKRELVNRIYRLRPGQIGVAVDLTADLIAANYWTRETSELTMQSVIRDAKDQAEYLARIHTIPGAADAS